MRFYDDCHLSAKHGLHLAAATYRVQWWGTWTGEVVKEEPVTHDGVAWSVRAPDFETDVACKITRADGQAP
jgi:hypothetical protein